MVLEAAPAQPQKIYSCRFCPKTYASVNGRWKHEGKEHPEEKAAAAAGDAMPAAAGVADDGQADVPPPPTGGAQPRGGDAMSEQAKQLAEALDAAVPALRVPTRRQLLLAYQDDAEALTHNKIALENFLGDYGLTVSQIRMICRQVLGSNRNDTATGQQTVMAFNPATGQSTPVIVMGGQSAPAQPQPYPQPVIIQQPGASEAPPAQGVTRDDMRDMVTDLWDRMEQRLAAAQPPPSQNVRTYHEPMRDASGTVMTDANGAPLVRIVQEPIDAMGNAFKFMSDAGLLKRDEPAPAPSVEEISARVRADLGNSQQREPDPVLATLSSDFAQLRGRLERDDAVREAVTETTNALVEQFQPQLERLRDIEGRQGMTDYQAQINSQRDTSKDFMGSLNSLSEGLRADLRPLVIQVAASNLKQLGFSDTAIADMMRPPPAPVDPGGMVDVAKRRAASTFDRWTR